MAGESSYRLIDRPSGQAPSQHADLLDQPSQHDDLGLLVHVVDTLRRPTTSWCYLPHMA